MEWHLRLETHTYLLPFLSTCLSEQDIVVRVGQTAVTNRLKYGSNLIKVHFLIGRCSLPCGESETQACDSIILQGLVIIYIHLEACMEVVHLLS